MTVVIMTCLLVTYVYGAARETSTVHHDMFSRMGAKHRGKFSTILENMNNASLQWIWASGSLQWSYVGQIWRSQLFVRPDIGLSSSWLAVWGGAGKKSGPEHGCACVHDIACIYGWSVPSNTWIYAGTFRWILQQQNGGQLSVLQHS